MSGSRGILFGIACGAGAGALWGLVFLAPELARSFAPIELTMGRYLFYGLFAAILIGPRWRELSHRLTRREWLALSWLGFAGNTLYYILLSAAVQLGGIAMTSLIIGFLPVLVTIVGSRERDALPLQRLLPSLLLCVVGVMCIGLQGVHAASVTASITSQIAGLLCAIGALASWTIFAVGNARWLRRIGDVSADDWNILTGVVTGAQTLLLIPIALVLHMLRHDGAAWARFAMVSGGIALLASIVGNGLWNRMSRLLPLTLAGQMILFETVFALLYGFLWEHRLPTGLEAAAFTLVVLSVTSCIAAHRTNPTDAYAVS